MILCTFTNKVVIAFKYLLRLNNPHKISCRSLRGSPTGIKRESSSPLVNGIHHNHNMKRMKREIEMAEFGGHYSGASSDGDSGSRDDHDELIGMDKSEDLAEDLSFASSSHTADSSRLDQ